MRFASNVGSAVAGVGGRDDIRRANKVVKFGLFCSKAGQSSRKVRH